ncbi:hypothetical protein LWE61_08565 [Sphingobium sufflavum]|uniref:hypothetical protein n=1 Tax=Sphingobium sufflavum TaxID=1129547 RepID=UPI001F31F7D3|nr:hypothetical protein [Sphingobium sufflavum]MCE7796610.1 hypothetical protein [Sphingobium sufflavum]
MRIEDRLPGPILPRAETSFIGTSRIGVEAEQQALPGGMVSNRAMISVKMPF